MVSRALLPIRTDSGKFREKAGSQSDFFEMALTQGVLDRSTTTVGSGVPTWKQTVISDHRQKLGKSLATNIDQERLLGDIKVQY
jgi:hypothetical protein